MRRASKDTLAKIRSRLIKARKLAGLTLNRASIEVGYSGKSSLWKIEEGYLNVVPSLDLLIKCSRCYGVSMDYLLGVSDLPEGDPTAVHVLSTLRTAERFMESHSRDISQKLIEFSTNNAPLNLLHEELYMEMHETLIKFDKFKELNNFDELRGGNSINIKMSNLQKMVKRIYREKNKTENLNSGYLNMVSDLISENRA